MMSLNLQNTLYFPYTVIFTTAERASPQHKAKKIKRLSNTPAKRQRFHSIQQEHFTALGTEPPQGICGCVGALWSIAFLGMCRMQLLYLLYA